MFPNLLPGTYNVKVELQGFQSTVRNGVELQTQQTARMDFSLAIGTLAETVEIIGSAPMINTEDTAMGTVIDNRRIVDLPLNGRNFLQLVVTDAQCVGEFCQLGPVRRPVREAIGLNSSSPSPAAGVSGTTTHWMA